MGSGGGGSGGLEGVSSLFGGVVGGFILASCGLDIIMADLISAVGGYGVRDLVVIVSEDDGRGGEGSPSFWLG